MVSLYMDVHVPRAITLGLRGRGVDVLTAQEDRTEELTDPELLDRTTELGRVLFTQDADFLREGAERQRQGIPFAGILFASQAPSLIGLYIQDLELVAQVSEPQEYINQVIRIPL